MTKYYIPGDPNSSPYEPTMGEIVIYRQHRQGLAQAEHYPAIIIKAYPDDRADLWVFSPVGVRYVASVRYSGDNESQHSYGWMPERIKRPVAPEAMTPANVEG